MLYYWQELPSYSEGSKNHESRQKRQSCGGRAREGRGKDRTIPPQYAKQPLRCGCKMDPLRSYHRGRWGRNRATNGTGGSPVYHRISKYPSCMGPPCLENSIDGCGAGKSPGLKRTIRGGG